HTGALLAALAGALVLANSRSLALAVVVTALAAALYLAVLVQWMPERFDPVLAVFQALVDQLKQAGEETAFLAQIDLRQMVIERLGLLTGVTLLAVLLLALSHQASLYTPGGLRTEFHQLRLAPGLTFGLMLGMVLSQWRTEGLVWARM